MAKINPITKLKEKTADLKPPVFAQEVLVKNNIIIVPELRDLIPALTADESGQLKENIDKYGIKDPLSVWETTVLAVLEGLPADSASHELFSDYNNEAIVHILVDGHNRYQIANSGEKVLDYRINLLDFDTLNEVTEYMINYQLGRRNLNPDQISYLRGKKYNNLKTVNNSVNVAQQLAEEFGVSSRTIKRDGNYSTGIDKLEPELKADVLAGNELLTKEAAIELSKVDVVEKLETIADVEKVLPKKKIKAVKPLIDTIEQIDDSDSIPFESHNGNSSDLNSSGEAESNPNQLEAFSNSPNVEEIEQGSPITPENSINNEPEIFIGEESKTESNIVPEIETVSEIETNTQLDKAEIEKELKGLMDENLSDILILKKIIAITYKLIAAQ